MEQNKQPERIPAKEAIILWSTGDGVTPTDVVAVVRRGDWRIEDGRNYPSSLGAICSGWCEDGHPLSSPEGVFAAQILAGPTSPQVITAWLEEFATIEECEWARAMIAALLFRQERDGSTPPKSEHRKQMDHFAELQERGRG